MKQLTVKEIKTAIKDLPDNTIVYIGDDEELNGLHEAYYIQNCSAKEMKLFSQNSINKAGVLIS